MTRTDIHEIAALTDAARQADAARLRDIRAEEDQLRQALARLDAAGESSMALSAPQWHGLRAIGADLLWQRWADRTRRDLQQTLAHVLARKEIALAALRLTHGRSQAAAQLVSDDRAAQSGRRDRQRAVEWERLVLLNAADPAAVRYPDGRYR